MYTTSSEAGLLAPGSAAGDFPVGNYYPPVYTLIYTSLLPLHFLLEMSRLIGKYANNRAIIAFKRNYA